MVTRNSRKLTARQRAGRLPGPEKLEQRRVLAAVLSMQGPAEVVFEGERAEFTLQLSERSSRAETVFVTTQPGTATLGVDYAAAPRQQVIFAPGETIKRLSISTLAEAVPRREGPETFFVTATPANPALSAPLTAGATIVDMVPKPAASVADITVTEGNGGVTPATFTITLSSAYPRAVTVAYATRDGSATVADNDYAATTGRATFLPGQTSQTVTVNVNGDRIGEPDETFLLTLSAPTNATIARGTAICTIVNDEQDQLGFQITLDYRTTMQPAWKAAVERATAKWSSILVGDLPGVVYEGRFIDDFEISVTVQPLGAGLLGYARTLQSRPGVGGLPFLGEMVMNSLYANQAGFYDTVAHELAHALGFNPTLWTSLGLFGGTLADPRFTGANATREFNQIFSRTDAGVPLYERGQPGDGSYGAHWRDDVFGKEMMVSAGDPNETGFPISRITVASMADIGYTVNYAAADPYVAGGGGRFVLPLAMTVAARQSPETIKAMAVARPLVHLLAVKPAAIAVASVSTTPEAPVKPVAVASGKSGPFNVARPKPNSAMALLSRTGALGG